MQLIDTVPIVIAILTALFIIQQFGTGFVGRFFGPIMLIWFVMLGVLGIMSLGHHPCVLKAINPYYAYELLTTPRRLLVAGCSISLYDRSRRIIQ